MEKKLVLSRRLSFLISLSYYNKNKKSTLSDFERYLGFDLAQPDIRELLKFLIDMTILNETDLFYGNKRYKLNTKKLDNYLQELEAFKIFYKYFDTKKTIINF